MQFKELNIIPEILKAIEEEKYEIPTPIQEKAIPAVLNGRDLLGCAQTGTGKTAAFAIPMLQLLNKERITGNAKRNIRGLIITPTRELALQIYESFCTYGKYVPLKCCVVFGGVSQKPQEEILKRGVDILVATPGRLNDLINQQIIDLKSVKIFILDEADRMLDMGFIHDVKKIIAKTPAKKQTLLFSATMPTDIEVMSDSILHDPVKIEITPKSSTANTIEQRIYYVDKGNKKDLLIHILKDPGIESALVFTRTKHGADKLVRHLIKEKVEAKAIHGDKSQGARQNALGSFKDKTLRVLVATDIAARGIDIDELSHVINYDLPNIPETYVHRIGRTGRAGLGGVSISFCDFDEKEYLADIEKLIRKRIAVIEEHPYPLLNNFPAEKVVQPPRRDPSKKAEDKGGRLIKDRNTSKDRNISNDRNTSKDRNLSNDRNTSKDRNISSDRITSRDKNIVKDRNTSGNKDTKVYADSKNNKYTKDNKNNISKPEASEKKTRMTSDGQLKEKRTNVRPGLRDWKDARGNRGK